MTPKEKAQELLEEFYWLADNFPHYRSVSVLQTRQYALIAVNEIIKNHNFPCENPVDLICDVEYWEEVKQEIEKL
jgi:hypothetical protein